MLQIRLSTYIKLGYRLRGNESLDITLGQWL